MTNSPNQNVPPDNEAERIFDTNLGRILDEIDRMFQMGSYRVPRDTSILASAIQDPALLQPAAAKFNAYALKNNLPLLDELPFAAKEEAITQLIELELDERKSRQNNAAIMLKMLVIAELTQESISSLYEQGNTYSAKKMIAIELLMNAARYQDLPGSVIDVINQILPGEALNTNPLSQEYAEYQELWIHNQAQQINANVMHQNAKELITDLFGTKLTIVDIEVVTARLVTMATRQRSATISSHEADIKVIITFFAERDVAITPQALQSILDAIIASRSDG